MNNLKADNNLSFHTPSTSQIHPVIRRYTD